ncbi:MAG: nuclear transport factor 2 family protein [candidate division Zixibacteria bacterium]|nr:nuclear transport factor 2 family protein [candidate division Zixibacteria bacterium]
MKSIITAMILALLASGVTMGSDSSKPLSAAEQLAATERLFAATSVDSGMTVAFLRFLNDEAVVFRPGPISGRRWYSDRSNTTAYLNWQPEFIEIASSGDLGYSTGPWEYRSSRTDTTSYYGHFVSIWQRQADGKYQVLADLGIDHDAIARQLGATPLQLSTLSSPVKAVADSHDTLIAGLKAVEKAFSDATAKSSLAKGLAIFGDENIRLYRPGGFPLVGRKGLESLPEAGKSRMQVDTRFADVSANGDLGYTYGFVTLWPVDADLTSGAVHSYLRVWKKNPGGEWKIALDIALPMK